MKRRQALKALSAAAIDSISFKLPEQCMGFEDFSCVIEKSYSAHFASKYLQL